MREEIILKVGAKNQVLKKVGGGAPWFGLIGNSLGVFTGFTGKRIWPPG